jgi:hypothetical protein
MTLKQSVTSSGSVKSGTHPKYGHGLLKDFLFAPNFVNLNHGMFGLEFDYHNLQMLSQFLVVF